MTAPPRFRGITIPSEHGGWGLTLEPVALGLAVAPSVAGVALGLAALAAFMFRTPLKIIVGDLQRGRSRPGTGLALRAGILYGVILLLAVVIAIVTTDHQFWSPLAAAVPFMAIQAAYDARSRSRRIVPEVAGPVGIGSVAAAITLAGGGTMGVALGLWLVLGLRSIASVILVRAQLRRFKQQHYREWPVHLVDVSVAATGFAAAAFGVIPWLGAAAITLLSPFGWLSLWRPAVRAVNVGIHQTLLGVVVVVLTAVGVRAGV